MILNLSDKKNMSIIRACFPVSNFSIQKLGAATIQCCLEKVLGQDKADTNHVLREISNHNNTIHRLEVEGGWIIPNL